MIRKYLLTSSCSLFTALLFVGCDKDEVESLESHFSYRDGVYEGKTCQLPLTEKKYPQSFLYLSNRHYSTQMLTQTGIRT